MKAAVTVKENYEFRRIYRKGKSLVSPQMVLYWQKNRQGQSRLGVTVSTKLGHAVPPLPGAVPAPQAGDAAGLRRDFSGPWAGRPQHLSAAGRDVSPPAAAGGPCTGGDGMKRALLKLFRFYQTSVSPLFPPRCRYIPTCSEYAVEAVEKYGAAKGGLLALRRLMRCHPFHKGGYDPVP